MGKPKTGGPGEAVLRAALATLVESGSVAATCERHPAVTPEDLAAAAHALWSQAAAEIRSGSNGAGAAEPRSGDQLSLAAGGAEIGAYASPRHAVAPATLQHLRDFPAHVIAYTDGASRGNPGPAGIGVYAVAPDGRTVWRCGRSIGPATNNVAEYCAALLALRAAATGGARHVDLRADSQLLIYQLTGRYRVKNPGLVPIHKAITEAAKGLARVTYTHIPREQNIEADQLANLGTDANNDHP